MRCVFRVDASLDIGTGHVVRCLTLAGELRKAGHESHFICRRHDGHLGAMIEQRGHRLTLLQQADGDDGTAAHSHWLGATWRRDAEDSIAAIAGRQADWLVLDHYALDRSWQGALRPHCKRMLVIDDLADRVHDADLLLDQNFYPGMERRYDGLLPHHALRLIGPRYAMLRDEFIEQRGQASVRSELRSLLVFFGGVDRPGLTLTALHAIRDTLPAAATTVIIGAGNPHTDDIEALCASMDNVRCCRQVDNMAELMTHSDLAIGAGGTTTWERCYLGLPAIVVTLADNQAAVNSAVADSGAVLLAGGSDTDATVLARLLQAMVDDPAALGTASQAAFDMMHDHVGAAGVVDAMERLHV